jgi:phosphoribosyl 1,2-cyclic phosphodiesterase
VLNVTFWGVRGSTPCPADGNRRYGGNTSCVTLEVPGEDPIVLDLGTGLRLWGESLPTDEPFRGTALLTHLHWDHVQGLPFFRPVLQPGAHLDVYGPCLDGITLGEAFDELMRPPYFPVRVRDLHGHIGFHEVAPGELVVGDAKVRVGPVPHTGTTNGYRVDWGGATVAYVSDHQSPRVEGREGVAVDEAVLELCDGVDLLIHDAQYWPHEWEAKHDWGHCTADYALRVARDAGVRRLVLFHHDPAHDDPELDRVLDHVRSATAGCGVEEVIAAAEGLTISLGGDHRA